MTKFLALPDFVSSHKMGDANVGEDVLLKNLGEGEGESDGKVENSWSGEMTTNCGETVKVSCWDWRGGMRRNRSVSVWCNRPEFLPEWIKFLEGLK